MKRLLSVAAVLCAVAVVSSQTPDGGNTAQAGTAQKRAAERLAALRRESDALAAQEQTLLVELRRFEVQRQMHQVELTTAQRELTDTERRVKETTTRAEALERDASAERPDVEARLVRLYKMGRAGYWRLLLDVNDVQQLGRAYRTAAALDRIDRARLEEHRRTIAALSRERETLEGHAREVRVLKARAQAARAAADKAVADRNALIASIDARRDLNAQLAGELQQAQARLQQSLTQMGGTGGTAAAALPIRPFRGALPWPAEGVLMRRFANGRGSSAGRRSGIELSLPEGAPVRAVHEGTVAYADQFTGYGNLVIVDHGNRSYSLYGNLSEINVVKGDAVAAGATVGLTGRNTAGNPSLYFELRIDGQPVDPLQWLKRR
ncbi:MAG TPA: peptidoglycan DD-metalloendopeptidase family protein [Gemmatimonadaceae bacterium]